MGAYSSGSSRAEALVDYRAAAHESVRVESHAGKTGADEEVFWTAGVATDVAATWRRYGWIPPSELPEFQAKWDFFKTLRTRIR